MPVAAFVISDPLAASALTPMERLSAISEGLGGGSRLPVGWLLLILGLLVITLGLLRLQRWWQQRHLQAKPRQVFFTIARSVGVSLIDQWLLIRIARQQNLPSPLTLLLSPRTLRYHARQYVQVHPVRRRRAIMRRIVVIRRSLFGSMRHEKNLEARYEPPGMPL